MHHGDLLKQAREGKMTQKELGLAIGVDGSQISRYESKKEIQQDILLLAAECLDSTELRWESLGAPLKVPYLDRINQTIEATSWVLTQGKKGGEVQEMIDAIDRLKEINMINKLSCEEYTEKEKKLAYYIADQVMDVITCGFHCLKALKDRTGINLNKVEENHERKVISKGYKSGYRNAKSTSPSASAL